MAFSTLVSIGAAVAAAVGAKAAQNADTALTDYFRAETTALSERCLADVKTLEEWTSRREEYRRQLAEMLGLHPQPERTPLHAVITGRVENEQCTVEKVQFQSSPGLYVTGSLYVPKSAIGHRPQGGHPQSAIKYPAVLYVCGHAPVVIDGVPYGSKAAYQHHGEWLARNGYVCLMIDTLQLGEIEGIHHGTYREKMWWWNARGYTPAGVEAWNSIRALDYLETRPEVDADRLGVTGRSGGGAYSWWLAALDDRVKVAVPVAGITDLENHVVDGCVSGHCDCMFVVNTYRWDYAQVAALVAPRPLLIANSDKDSIFPLEGVFRVHAKVRQIYRLHDAADKLGLQITEGGHKDTQELRLHALTWLNRHLKGENPDIESTAKKAFTPAQLKVFAELPADTRNSRIHETFVPAAPEPPVPTSAEAWAKQRDAWMAFLREKVFAGWPGEPGSLGLRPASSEERDGVRVIAYDFESQAHVPLRLFLARSADGKKPKRVALHVLDEKGWEAMQAAIAHRPDEAIAWIAPRGIGPAAWTGDEKTQTQIRRRFMLLGQTLDGMRVWDVRRAIQALRGIDGLAEAPLTVRGEREMAGIALYAALFEPDIAALEIQGLPASHREGPDFLNVLRALDLPQAVAMAAERCRVELHGIDPAAWQYPTAVSRALGWDRERIEFRHEPPVHEGK